MVKLFEVKSPQEYIVSVGLAFVSFKKDLLILRIICSSTVQNYVEIELLGPMKSCFGWKNLENDLHFRTGSRSTCDVIFKGEPYWLAYLTDTPKSGQHEGVIRFNVGNMRLEWLPLQFIGAGYYIKYLVKVEYCLGMLTWEVKEKCYIDVWMMSHQEHDWSKKYKVGPFFGIDGFMGCLRNGDIAKYNPVTYSAKYGVKLPDAKKESHVIFDCPESLFLINGMEPFMLHTMYILVGYCLSTSTFGWVFPR
ncbi:hypothetical protein CQW23_35685 [Capsicum baccatum]|uniref:F-box associated domain-containing protein n=1 Tax=Capsicum baccatum TaxID=33114 RepID=A0A2G2UV59_CAPBA|nr:hypothetical protein CQW23_35685 [Capsicum baccatum]